MTCGTDVQLFPTECKLRFIFPKRIKLSKTTFMTALFEILLSFVIFTYWHFSKQLS